MSGFLSASSRLLDSAGPPLECHFPGSVGGVTSQLVIRGPGPSCGAGISLGLYLLASPGGLTPGWSHPSRVSAGPAVT